MNIPTKNNKGKCPHCKKWVKLVYDEVMKLDILKCCKVYSLFSIPEQPKKKKRKKK